ncbi:MAG: hypothetical protein ACXAC7_10600 [Candidatus Hodarchaeales archaeon]|jgi:hypothetical protein
MSTKIDKKIFTGIAIIIVLFGFISHVNAEEIIQGSFSIADPYDLTIKLYNGTTEIDTIIPDGITKNILNFTLNHPLGMKKIKFIDIFWYNTTYLTNYKSVTPDGYGLTHIQWIENKEAGGFPTGLDEWGNLENGLLTEWEINNNNIIDPGADNSQTNFTFMVPFVVSRAIIPDTWKISIDITWDDTTHKEESFNISMTTYSSLNVNINTLNWGALDVGEINQSQMIEVTVYSNMPWMIRLKTTNISSIEGTIDIDTLNVLFYDQDGVFNAGSGFRLHTYYQPINATTNPVIGENDPITFNLYFGLSYNPVFSFGICYNLDIIVQLQN